MAPPIPPEASKEIELIKGLVAKHFPVYDVRVNYDVVQFFCRVELGMIEPQEVYTHEKRSVIYRSLGNGMDLVVDTFRIQLEAGDRLLLCSDGLWEMVYDPIIEDVLLSYLDPQQACDRLVDLANHAGGRDNISVIVVNFLA